MQKVVGSSPIIRSSEARWKRRVSLRLGRATNTPGVADGQPPVSLRDTGRRLPGVPASDVAITLRCKECGAVWLPGRRAPVAGARDDPGGEHAEPELGFWCPDGAEREFGP
jgi:hypothetical protein